MVGDYNVCFFVIPSTTGNYTELISIKMDCSSSSGFPDVIVTTEPLLRQEIAQQLSRNPKVAFYIKCTSYNETVYFNRSTIVSITITCLIISEVLSEGA